MRRGSLTLHILLITAVNVAVLAGAFALFVSWQLRQEFESFLLAGGGERLQALSRTLESELVTTPTSEWDALLARHADDNDVSLQLAFPDGTPIAGARTPIPDAVIERLRPQRGGPGRGAGPPGGAADPNRPLGRGRGGPPGGGAPPLMPPMFLARVETTPSYWVGVRMPVRAPEDQAPTPAVLLVSSTSLIGNPLLFQPRPWITLVAVALGLSALCWLPWIGGLTRAVRRLEGATAAIAEGRFDLEIGVARNDEVGRLAGGIREMADRINTLLRGQKRFLSDAAHELRSPLTRMQLALELIDQQPPAKRAQYLQDVREDVEEMKKICEALLELGRNELREREWADDVDATSVVERAVRMEGRGVDVRTSIPADLRARGNSDQLVRAVANVVRNAAFYAGGDGPVEIDARRDGDRVEIAVRDHGPGVPEQELDQLFTPFYRLDAARDRRSGGTGLGLAIVRAAVEACGGRVECRNCQPRGLEVRLVLKGA